MSVQSKIQNPKSKIAYRSGQFFAALLGRASDEDMEEARRVLGPRLYEIFAELPGQYRLHMLAVYRKVRDAGCDDAHVLQAALLHDAGKYDPATRRYVSLPYRVAIVLLAATAPGKRLLAKLAEQKAEGRRQKAESSRMGWRYPFYLNNHHAELGAQRAQQHGATDDVVRLIADHHKPKAPDARLAALRAADERS